MGFRSIKRVKGVHHTTVITWVKPIGEWLPDVYEPDVPPEVGELDELETWNFNDKFCSVTNFRNESQLSLMLLRDNLITDRQPHPCPLSHRLGGEEGIKQAWLDMGRNARTIIGNANDDLCAFSFCPNRDATRSCRPCR